jgi:formylglycine-generating enzyme required for sulfatase activity
MSPAAPTGHDFVRIAAGDFVRGSDDFDIEAPERTEHLHAFEIDRYPVTVDQYARFCRATGHPAPPDFPDAARLSAEPELMRHPVERVSWHEATAYAAWAGLRLPTEAEWERAARGADGRRWPWGDRFDEARAVVWDNAKALGVTTVAIDRFPGGESSDGVRHLAGNVEEWVLDELVPYAGSAHRSPVTEGGCRVLRGGSWFYTNEYARGSFRRGALPEFTGYAGAGGPGFRCARDAD